MITNERIVLLTPSMSKGGAETQLLKLAEYLQEQGRKVLIISLKPIDEFGGEIQRKNLDIVFLDSWRRYPLFNFRRLYQLLRLFKPDVVIAFMFAAILFGRLLKIRMGYKLISSIRISVLPKKWYLLFKISSSVDDIVVYNSEASRDSFEKMKISLGKGIVIGNSISIPVLRLHNDVRMADKPFVWVCIGHFRWNKDYKTLFNAISLMKGRKFRLDIIGELNHQKWPSEMIEKLGIRQYVNLYGFKQDPGRYLKTADAFVLSSFSEGMPNAMLEAMANAVPVVVTDIAVNKMLMDEADCGLLSQKKDSYSLACSMMKIMDMSVTDRQMIGEYGRAYVVSKFTEQQVMKQWDNVINQVSV